MNSFKTSLISKSIAFACLAGALASPALAQFKEANILGTPNDGMVCRSGYTPSFSGTSLKCSKTTEIKVPLACLNAPFLDKVVRANNELDVCDKPGGVTITSTNNISNFVKGSDYVNAKQDDAQISVRTASQRQTEATALGVTLGEVDVEVGTIVTNTTDGDSTDKSVVRLTLFTFATPAGGLVGNQSPVGGLPATANSTSAFVPKALPR